MTAKLFCKFGPLKGANFDIKGEASIGRGKENAIVLDNDAISGKHAHIRFDKASGRYMLEDLGSLNGTRLDGTKISMPERLGHLHVITFVNDINFIFQDLNLCAQRRTQVTADELETVPADDIAEAHQAMDDQVLPKHATSPDEIPAVLPDALRGRQSGKKSKKEKNQTFMDETLPVLPKNLADLAKQTYEEYGGDDANLVLVLNQWEGIGSKVFPLKPGKNTIGRGSETDIAISSSEVSRKHAIITLENDKIYLEDTGSTNKTYLDGKAIEKRVQVSINQRIGFGKVKCIVTRDSELDTAGLPGKE